MKPIPLREFVRRAGSQVKAAKLLGVTQSAISQALKRERAIYCIPDSSGGWTYYEVIERAA